AIAAAPHRYRRPRPRDPRPRWKPMMRLVLTGMLILDACSILPEPKPVRYRTVVLDATKAGPAPSRGPVATMALRAVELPRYLDADAVVMRTSANEIHYSRDERWGEPLTEAVPRVLAADLGMDLAAAGVELLPPGSRADSYVDVTIQRFEIRADGKAELRARWSLHDREHRAEPRAGDVYFVDEQGGPPAAGLSRLLGRFGEAIAADARSVSAANP